MDTEGLRVQVVLDGYEFSGIEEEVLEDGEGGLGEKVRISQCVARMPYA